MLLQVQTFLGLFFPGDSILGVPKARLTEGTTKNVSTFRTTINTCAKRQFCRKLFFYWLLVTSSFNPI